MVAAGKSTALSMLPHRSQIHQTLIFHTILTNIISYQSILKRIVSGRLYLPTHLLDQLYLSDRSVGAYMISETEVRRREL